MQHTNEWPQGLEPGIYFGLEEKDYFADPAVNSSILKIALTGSPNDFWKASALNKEKELTKTTPEMLFGKMLHKLVFEYDHFADSYRVLPGADNDQTKQVVYKHDYIKAMQMRQQLLENKYTAALLTGKGYSEVSLFWRDPITGIMCKSRHDMFKAYASVDLKTVYSVSDSDLARLWKQRNYFVQGYHYLGSRKAVRSLFRTMLADGSDIHDLPVYGNEFDDWDFIRSFIAHDEDGFFNVAQRTSEPFPFRFWQLSDDSVQYGRDRALEALQQIKYWTETYGTEIEWPISHGKPEEMSALYGFTRHV